MLSIITIYYPFIMFLSYKLEYNIITRGLLDLLISYILFK